MKNFLLLLLLLSGFTSQSQTVDRIITVNQDTIKCQVKEIGDDEIKYLQQGDQHEVMYGIDKNKVAKIVFLNGREVIIRNSLFDPTEYQNQKKTALKIAFLSPLFGATNISIEHAVRPGKSWEGTLGLIGLGSDIADNKPSGVFVKVGYKFIKSPDFYLKGIRFSHILQGSYLRPELCLSTYSSQITNYLYGNGTSGTGSRGVNTQFALMLNTGKQWVIQNRYLFDWFIGVGYSFGHAENNEGFHYAFIGGSSGNNLAFTSGIRIGVLL